MPPKKKGRKKVALRSADPAAEAVTEGNKLYIYDLNKSAKKRFDEHLQCSCTCTVKAIV